MEEKDLKDEELEENDVVDEVDDDDDNDIDNDPETEVSGDSTMWKTLVRKYNEENDYLDVTTAMETSQGVVVRTFTLLEDETTEALCFIPGASLEKDENGNYHIV